MVWLAGGHVFDATGAPRVRADVRIDDGCIAEVVPGGASAELLEGLDPAELIDASGLTILPGLIDAHAHVGILTLTDQARLAPAVQAAAVFRNLATSLDQGFTTLRDLGGVDGGVVKAMEAGLVEGPRVLPSGEILSQTAGHGDHRNRWGHDDANPATGSGLALAMRIADGVSEVTRAARDQFRRGATQLKLFASGGQLSEGDPIDSPQYTEEELAAAVAVAADRDSYVTVHAHTVRGIHRALAAGVRCFEHATDIDAETVEALRAHGAVTVPTLTVLALLKENAASIGVPAEWLGDVDRLRAAASESIRMLDAAGVPMGSGADIVGMDQLERGWELALKGEILGGAKAIESATRVNAEILGIAALVGTVTAGKQADLVLYAGDPVADPALFRSAAPVLVVQAGRVVRDRRGDAARPAA